MLHHVFWFSVFAAYSFKCNALKGVGLSVFILWIFVHKTLVQHSHVTTQCGDFRVCNVNLRAHDTRIMTTQCS